MGRIQEKSEEQRKPLKIILTEISRYYYEKKEKSQKDR
jgi:hypothetical protein